MIDIANDLDLYDDELVEITKRAKETREIVVSGSEFSKTFSVPSTARNNAVFGYYANIEVDSTINPHKAIPAFWTVYLNTRYSGVLEVKGCVYENGYPKSYNLVFYGRVRNLASVFGEDRLTDIDWSSLDHELNYDNVYDSWGGDLFGGDVMYPLIDYEKNFFMGDSSQNIAGNIRNQSNGILLGDLKPALKFRKMIQLIFENYGLSISGTLDDASMDNLFVQPNNRAGSLVNYEEFSENYIEVFGTDQDLPTDNSNLILEMPTEVQDDNNNWTGDDTFTAPLPGDYTFSWQITASVGAPSPFFKFETFVLVNGVESNVAEYSSTLFDTLNPTRFITLNLSAGDTVQFGAREVLLINPTITIDLSRVKTLDLPSIESGVTMQFINTMPNDKIVDFINGILKAYRWVVVPGEFESEWKFLSESDWRAEGTSRDWSNYINLNTISYQKPNVYKSIRLTTAESKSAIQTAFFAEQQRRFGEIHITPDIDFGQDSFEVESPFTLWPPSIYNVLGEDGEVLEISPITIYKMLDIEGSPTQDKFLMFYNNQTIGVLPASQNYYLQSGSSGGDPTLISMIEYPVCGFADGGEVYENGDNTSTYSIESPLVGAPPIETIYKKYWEFDLYNIYADGARVCTADFYLPQDQFLSFELNDTIFCEGRRWYIDEFTYNTLTGKAKVVMRSKEPIEKRARVNGVEGGGKIEFSDTPDAFVRSSVNAGANLAGSYYLNTAKSALLGNRLTYTEAKTNVFVTYVNGVTGDLLGWGDE